MNDPGNPAAERHDVIDLGAGLRIRAPDGSILAILPGPKGIGAHITVVPQRDFRRRRTQAPHRGRGRPASEATIQLRKKLRADKDAGRRLETKRYVTWFAKEARVAPGPAAQTVRREIRRLDGNLARSRARRVTAA